MSILAAGVVALYALVGFILVPWLISSQAPGLLEESLGRRASLGEVRCNPFGLRLEVEGFRLETREGGETPLASCGRLVVDLELASLWRWAWVFRELSLEDPFLLMVLEEDGSLNLAQLGGEGQAAPRPETVEATAGPPRLMVGRLAIQGGRVLFQDQYGRYKASSDLKPINLELKDLSTLAQACALPVECGPFTLTAASEKGERLAWRGSLELNPLASTGRLSITALQASSLWEFTRDWVDLAQAKGSLDLQADYRLDGAGDDLGLVFHAIDLQASDLRLQPPGDRGESVSLAALHLKGGEVDLVKGAIAAESLLLKGLRGTLVLDQAGRTGWQELTPADPGAQAEPRPEPQPAGDSTPWPITCPRIDILAADLALEDRGSGKPARAELAGLTLNLAFGLDAPSAPGLKLSEITLKGEKLSISPPGGGEAEQASLAGIELEGGELDLEGRSISAAKVRLTGLAGRLARDAAGHTAWADLAAGPPGAAPAAAPEEASPAWRVALPRVEVSGGGLVLDEAAGIPLEARLAKLEAGLGLYLNREADSGLGLEGLTLTLQGLELQRRDNESGLLALERVDLTGGGLDLAQRRAGLESLSITGGRGLVSLTARRRLNWAQVLEPWLADQASPEAAEQPAPAGGEPWRVALGRASLGGLAVSFQDASLAGAPEVARLEDISLTLKGINLPLASAWPFSLAARLASGGSLEAKGSLASLAPDLEADCTVKGLALSPLGPYLAQATQLDLAGGSLSLTGGLGLGRPAGESGLRFKGQASLEGLGLRLKGGEGELLGLEKLSSQGLTLELEPGRLALDQATLAGLRALVRIDRQGRVNLVEALAPPEPAPGIAATPAPPTAPAPAPDREARPGQNEGFAFSLERLRLVRGEVDFADYSLNPNFSSVIRELSGTLSGFSSRPGSRLQVGLRGRVDQYGQAKVQGHLSPWDPAADSRLNLIFKNIDMTHLSPYSGKFAGYSIAGGKMDLDLGYRLEDSYLRGENHVKARGLVLGSSVASDESVGLPLELAIALLKDSSGVIDVDIPVEGDLGDPEVSIGGIIWKAVASLITKVVTAPFQILASLVGGEEGEDLSWVGFEPGSRRLPPPQEGKLAKLSQALQERPLIKLEVAPGVDPGRDGERLKVRALRAELARAQGLEPQAGPGEAAVNFSSQGVGRALEELAGQRLGNDTVVTLKREMMAKLAQETSGMKAEAAQAARTRAQAELNQTLYRRLLAAQPEPREALAELAEERRQAVAQFLVKQQGLAPDRLTKKDSAQVSVNPAGLVPTRLGLGESAGPR